MSKRNRIKIFWRGVENSAKSPLEMEVINDTVAIHHQPNQENHLSISTQHMEKKQLRQDKMLHRNFHCTEDIASDSAPKP